MIIIDFIDMITRADKLAMMEELEIALEPDKAKPQVGQLSDLGLVELTRHRQGQSLSEIFTKRCPHCQGSGYFMNELNFATPTAEGEYRAKQAKIKMPVNNGNNKAKLEAKPEQNQEQVSEIQEVSSNSVDVENPSISAGEVVEVRNNKRNRRDRFNKNRKQNKDEVIESKDTIAVETPMAQAKSVEPQDDKPSKQVKGRAKKSSKEQVKENKEELVEVTKEPQPVEDTKPKKLPRKAKKSTKKAAIKAEIEQAKADEEKPKTEASNDVEKKPRKRRTTKKEVKVEE